MKTNELTGAALDWAVAKCEGIETKNYSGALTIRYDGDWWQPSTDWAQGGPIIERERINVYYDGGEYWCATTDTGDAPKFGPTPLITAMRCYVASKLGAEIEIPEELKEGAEQ